MRKKLTAVAATAALSLGLAAATPPMRAEAASAKHYAGCKALNKKYAHGVRKASTTRNKVYSAGTREKIHDIETEIAVLRDELRWANEQLEAAEWHWDRDMPWDNEWDLRPDVARLEGDIARNKELLADAKNSYLYSKKSRAKVSGSIYKANKHLDGDRDGIACER